MSYLRYLLPPLERIKGKFAIAYLQVTYLDYAILKVGLQRPPAKAGTFKDFPKLATKMELRQ